MADNKSEILQGTLDLMVLKTLDAMGPLHGYGIARRIEQISEEALQVNQGTIYLCLVRLRPEAAGSPPHGARPTTTGARSSTPSRRPAGSSWPPKPQNWARVAGVIGRLLESEARVDADVDATGRVGGPRARRLRPATRSIATSMTSSSRIWRCSPTTTSGAG